MACCSSTKTLEFASEIDSSAGQLAALLAQAPEYQEFIRLAQLITPSYCIKMVCFCYLQYHRYCK
jgi:hypothetical protein